MDVEVRLRDALGDPPTGGGTVRVRAERHGTLLHESPEVAYTGEIVRVPVPAGDAWTLVKVSVKPQRYAATGVTVRRGDGAPAVGDLNNTLATAGIDGPTLGVSLVLLRMRAAPGVARPGSPSAGADLGGAWLASPPGSTATLYRDLLVHGYLNATTVRSLEPAVFADPAAPDWGRFRHRAGSVDPGASGAVLLAEYGGVGTDDGNDPRFLVSIWAPTLPSGTMPRWRDAIVLFHPSTARDNYPVSPYPFRERYPYVVGTNPDAPPSSTAHIYQPYVNLALKHNVGVWAPYHRPGNQALVVVPVYPHPRPGSRGKPSEDEVGYWLPFRTQAGMGRLLEEVNLFVHQQRYLPGVGFDTWNGRAAVSSGMARSPADGIHFFPAAPTAPSLRRVAVAGYSASSAPLDALIQSGDVSGARWPKALWGSPPAVFAGVWAEVWGLDLLYGKATVAGPEVAKHLLRWVGQRSARRFALAHSGTTGGAGLAALYPVLAAEGHATVTVGPPAGFPRRTGTSWRADSGGWSAMLLANALLLADTRAPLGHPEFPVATGTGPVDADLAHGFMYQLSLGLQLTTTTVGAP